MANHSIYSELGRFPRCETFSARQSPGKPWRVGQPRAGQPVLGVTNCTHLGLILEHMTVLHVPRTEVIPGNAHSCLNGSNNSETTIKPSVFEKYKMSTLGSLNSPE